MGSVTNVSDLSLIDIVGVLTSCIGVKDNADSRDIRFESMLEKIVPNLLVKDESFQLKDNNSKKEEQTKS